MAQQNVPMGDNTRLVSLRNGTVSDILEAFAVVHDSTTARGIKLPGTATTSLLADFAGITFRKVATLQDGPVICIAGDTAKWTASGTVAKGDRVFIDTAAGKEGRGKTYASFGANGKQMVVGVALTDAADGETFEVHIAPVVVGDGFQAGVATLAAGTVVVGANIVVTATSRVFTTRKTTSGVPGPSGICTTNGGRTVGGLGVGSLTFICGTLADPIVATGTDLGTFDWMIVG